MKKNDLEKKVLLFLYAYLRQIDLSLDRSRWTSWNELKDYYKNQINPKKVVIFLLQYSHVEMESNNDPHYIKSYNLMDKIKALIFRFFGVKNFLSKSELLYCCQKLMKFDEYLKSTIEIDKLDIERLRIEIAILNYDIIEYKLSMKDRKKAMFVQHFLQNKIVEGNEIIEFINGFEL